MTVISLFVVSVPSIGSMLLKARLVSMMTGVAVEVSVPSIGSMLLKARVCGAAHVEGADVSVPSIGSMLLKARWRWRRVRT